MNEYPRVSVIVSTYNRGERLLPLALDSILEQDYGDFEVIVMDDASTDCTSDVLNNYYTKFAKRDVELRAGRLSNNSGYQCVPKNMAIYMAKGDYIAYLDDDNEWMKKHLSRMMSEFDKSSELDLVYCWRKYIKDGHEGLKVDGHPPDWEKARLMITAFANCIDTSDMIHSRGLAYLVYDKYEQIWGEDEMRYGDLHLLRRFIQVGARAKVVPEELTRYRWHGDNLMITRPLATVTPATVDEVLKHVN